MILTQCTGPAMSMCIQAPGKSNPILAAMKRPAHDDWALLRFWNNIETAKKKTALSISFVSEKHTFLNRNTCTTMSLSDVALQTMSNTTLI